MPEGALHPEDLWEKLNKAEKPVVLYGTGNAAEKIMNELDIRSIRVSGIFASDGFVRDRYFHGFKVLSYAAAKEAFGDMIVLLCFGSHRPEVLENIEKIASEQELYAPDLPVAGDGLFDAAYYKAHRAELEEVRGLLADEQSRLVLESLIEYKISGCIEPLLSCQTPEDENWRLLLEQGRFLRQLSGDAAGAEALPVFMDLGAYTGDTLELFSGLCAEPFRAVAVEPEARNFRKLLESAERLFPQTYSVFGQEAESAKALCTLVNAAAGDECRTIEFTHGAGRGGAGGKGKTRPALQLTADHILKELGMLQGQGSAGAPAPKAPLPLIIKMDLEGAEAAAIRGAENTIKTLKPSMLVSAYHRTEDLFALPRLILGLRADYRLFLRRDPCIPAWGVNYFFI